MFRMSSSPKHGAGRATGRPLGRAALVAGVAACWLLLAVGQALAATPYTAYVANQGLESLTPINTLTNTPGSPTHVARPYALAITPDGSTAWVTDEAHNTLDPISLSTGTVGQGIGVGSEPHAVAITPDGSRAYVANYGSGTITPINLSTRTAEAAIRVGNNPIAVAIAPNGSTAYVANSGSKTVSVINLASASVSDTITAGNEPWAIAITPDGSTAYVVDLGSSNVMAINLQTDDAVSTIAVTQPNAIAIAPNGQEAYVSTFRYGYVTPINLQSAKAEAQIPVGKEPYSLAITPDGTTAYVANAGEDTVTPISLASNTAGPAITVGSGSVGPAAVAIAPAQTQASRTVAAGAGLSPSLLPAFGAPMLVRPTSLLISVRSVVVSPRGYASIPITCPKSAVDGCKGTITLKLVQPKPRHPRAVAARCGRGCRPLASAHYEARAGQRLSVQIHISSYGRALLKRHGSLPTSLTATSVLDGRTVSVARTVSLKVRA